MVNYDSKSKNLVYKMVYQINGETLYSQSTEVSLDKLDEATRQIVIAVAKISVSFANGNSIAQNQLRPALINGAKATSDMSAQKVADLTGLKPDDAAVIMAVEKSINEAELPPSSSSELTV